MKVEMARQLFVKLTDIKFHEDPFSRSRIITYTRTDGVIFIGAPQEYERV
jgi:hypothetical protein